MGSRNAFIGRSYDRADGLGPQFLPTPCTSARHCCNVANPHSLPPSFPRHLNTRTNRRFAPQRAFSMQMVAAKTPKMNIKILMVAS